MASKAPRCIVDFYFDVISPYAYVGLEAILRYETILPVTLNLKPVSLGAIFKATNNIPLRQNPAKFAYLVRDMRTVSRYWGLPLNFPANFDDVIFKHGGRKANLLLTAISESYPDFLRPAALEFARCIYVKNEPIHHTDHIRVIAERIGVPDVDKLIAQSENQATKDQAIAWTKEAIDSGAFGVPWTVLKRPEEEIVLFGGDRLPFLCQELGVDFKGPNISKL